MNESHDPRPLQTVNRLRLLVAVPVIVACIGVFFLAKELTRHFRGQKAQAAQGAPTSRPGTAGTVGQSIPAAARPKARVGTASATQPTVIPTAPVPTIATSAPVEVGVAAVVADPPARLDASIPAAAAAVGLLSKGIVGRVILKGTPPPAQVLPLDPSCGKLHQGGAPPRSRFYVVSTNSTLADVFVVLRGLPEARWEAPVNPVEIRQRGCEYLPYISGAQIGQVIRVFNDDPLMHNVHPTPAIDGNKEQNRVQLNAAAPPLDHIFPKPEPFLRFKCDVHPWMFAYVSVGEHPFFAVTDADGRFAIPEPPPGSYSLEFIHRRAGNKLVPLTGHAGTREAMTVTFEVPSLNPTPR
jgi:hypothetical protein